MTSFVDDILNNPQKEEDDFYDTLGCNEHSTEEQVNTEYKARVLSCHPDKHPDDPEAAKRFAKLQKAKDVLGDAETRDKYDKWRRSGIAMSYDQWCGLKDSVHTSMHWASKKSQPMIDSTTREIDKPLTNSQSAEHTSQRKPASFNSERPIQSTKTEWVSDSPSEMLRKFRNYEI